MRLSLLVLRTCRLEETKSFYEALGAKFVSEKHGNGPAHYAGFLGEGLVLELYPALEDDPKNNRYRLGFAVPSIEAVLIALGKNTAINNTQFGRRAVVQDPDGRAIELSE